MDDPTQPTQPIPTFDGPPTAQFPAQAPPPPPIAHEPLPHTAAPSEPAGPPARGRGWSGSAIAVVVLLAATTVGGVGYALYERSQASDVDAELDAARNDADDLRDELDGVQESLDDLQQSFDEQAATLQTTTDDLAAAQTSATELQASLEATNADLTEIALRYENLAALFPINVDSLANAELAGSYALSNTPIPDACVGFSDPAASCVAENFPTDLTIEGSPSGGMSVSSSWFAAIPLSVGESGLWTASGGLFPELNNTCNGVDNPTTVTIELGAGGVLPDEVNGGLFASELFGSVTLSSPETSDCVGASRAADFVTAVG